MSVASSGDTHAGFLSHLKCNDFKQKQGHIALKKSSWFSIGKNRLEENQEDDYCGNLEEKRRWSGTLC